MVVYWDLAAAWNFALDYILLLGTLRIAGRPVRRLRLAAAAALGAAYSVAALALPLPPWLLPGIMLLMCFAAFGGTKRWPRLALLFAMLSCGLGGAVLLLGQLTGGLERVMYGLLYARLPWGVFVTAAGLSWLLMTFVFRGGAKAESGDLVRALVERNGKQIELMLFRDTGNCLTDPLTGEGVPVVEREALLPLLPGEMPRTLRCRTVAGRENTLAAFRCDTLLVNGKNLGARLIAVSEAPFNGRYQGLWYDDREATGRENR